ncbi:1964_t:CDS:2 [Funneliformis geosporum]|uniref:1683_t:CDS:1 n=1 Tax=Funneliformis geosporum TaxID=1117311 RepID=A0A9W4SQQ6_9GLOM|nr:1964_t:CDS:2 [Funneliformis geosporum]CAI2178144.1 1683_t:CDS:2 [Funneliformis geosporum]
MSSLKKLKKSLWYKYQNNNTIRIRIESQLPSPEEEPNYQVLNDDLFHNCGNNYVTLRNYFEITKDNPIIVESVEVTTSDNNIIQELEARLAVLQMTQETSPATATSSTSVQASSNEIHFRYRNETFFFDQNALNSMRISNVEKLKGAIKFRLDIPENITLRNGENKVGSETPISELCNTESYALVVVVDDLTDKMSRLEFEPEFQYASGAFGCEFKNNLDYVGYFQNYITTCYNNSKDTYMPYISIVQSSGYGKSRLIKEYANEVYTLYLNLGIDRKCFPRPSACAKEFVASFQKAKDPVVWFNTFLAMAVYLVVSEVKKNNTDKSSFWRSHLDDNGQSIWDLAIRAANEAETSNDLISIRDNPGYLEESFTSENDIKLLLCIDEGRKLIQETNRDLGITLFRCWRRALQNNKWRTRGLFSVILDTTSRITNFSPASGYDPTIKALQEDVELFKPFIYISTYSSLVNNSDNFYDYAFSIGRPCWKALRNEYIKEVVRSDSAECYAWEKVKLLIKAKLQGGTNNPTDDEGKNLTSVALLASFCSVDISPSVHFASNLVASHLGTCLAISQDRTKILTCYPSEPLVTEAAYELLDDNMLFLIAQSFNQGVVEPGKRGEIVGELILILTRQKLYKRLKRAKKATFYTGEIKLFIFLEDLLKNNIVLKKNYDEHKFFKDANISFTRFVTIRTIPTLSDLEKGYKSCVAFNLKRNQQGADFLIPVKCNGKYTVWVIQIKNHNLLKCNSGVTEDSTSKLEPKYVFSKTDLAKLESPYLAMYWQLGAHQINIEEVEWGVSSRTREKEKQDKTSPYTHYTILGLKSFKVANGNTLKGLRTILEAYVDPYDTFWSSDKFFGDPTNHIESFLSWHPPDNKIDVGVLLDEYDDRDAEGPVQED